MIFRIYIYIIQTRRRRVSGPSKNSVNGRRKAKSGSINAYRIYSFFFTRNDMKTQHFFWKKKCRHAARTRDDGRELEVGVGARLEPVLEAVGLVVEVVGLATCVFAELGREVDAEARHRRVQPAHVGAKRADLARRDTHADETYAGVFLRGVARFEPLLVRGLAAGGDASHGARVPDQQRRVKDNLRPVD